jgi:hypothetical protein
MAPDMDIRPDQSGVQVDALQDRVEETLPT